MTEADHPIEILAANLADAANTAERSSILLSQFYDSARVFLEPYKELYDSDCRGVIDRTHVNFSVNGEPVTMHVARSILAFRKIIEQAGG